MLFRFQQGTLLKDNFINYADFTLKAGFASILYVQCPEGLLTSVGNLS
jgi:hypothetical protein